VSAPVRPAATERASEGPRDDEYARAYADGYGEGLREAMREMLAHLSRGHTPHEVRMIVESRLARVRDDVELKRKSLLAPPRRPSWGALLRPPSPGAEAPAATSPTEAVEGGRSVLFLEERPGRAIACVEASAAGFARVLVLSFHPPALRSVPAERVDFVPVRPGEGSDGADPTRLSGRILELLARDGGTLVYLDAVEVLSSEAGAERTSKFVTWLASEIAKGPSALIASTDPSALDPKERVLYQRAFNAVR
jgi:hypothetical protein